MAADSPETERCRRPVAIEQCSEQVKQTIEMCKLEKTIIHLVVVAY